MPPGGKAGGMVRGLLGPNTPHGRLDMTASLGNVLHSLRANGSLNVDLAHPQVATALDALGVKIGDKIGVTLSVDLVLMAIQSGRFDDDIERIVDQLSRRRAAVGAMKASELTEGDRLTIADTVRPKLLAGIACEFVGYEGRNLKVKLLQWASPKWREGMVITLPPTLIGRVAK